MGEIMSKKGKNVIGDGILNKVIEISESIPYKLKNIFNLVKVLNQVFAHLKDNLNFQKGYIVEFSVDTKKYHRLNDCFFGDWSKNSKKLFSDFFREHNEWRDVERGSLYKKLLNREDPLVPQLIEDWLKSKYKKGVFWIDDKLRKEEAEIKSAIVTPFVGWKGRHYLTMIALTEPPGRKKIQIHNLVLSRIVSELVSRGSKTFPIYSPESIIREKAKDLMDERAVGYDNIHHAQRVKKICERLAEFLTLNEKEIFQIKTAALLHDFGKTSLERDTINIDKTEYERFLRKSERRNKIKIDLLNKFEAMQKQNDKILRQHAEIGTTMLFRQFEDIIHQHKYLEWLFIVLAHHHYRDYYRKEPLPDSYLRKFLTEQEIKVRKNEKIYMREIKDHLKRSNPNILKLIDILVLADYFDDRCGWKFHRTETRQGPEGAMITILNNREAILMTKEVKDIIEIAKQSIFDIYDEPKLI